MLIVTFNNNLLKSNDVSVNIINGPELANSNVLSLTKTNKCCIKCIAHC